MVAQTSSPVIYSKKQIENLARIELTPEDVLPERRRREELKAKYKALGFENIDPWDLQVRSVLPGFERELRLKRLARRLQIPSNFPISMLEVEIASRLYNGATNLNSKGRKEAWWKRSFLLQAMVLIAWSKNQNTSIASFGRMLKSDAKFKFINKLMPYVEEQDFVSWLRVFLRGKDTDEMLDLTCSCYAFMWTRSKTILDIIDRQPEMRFRQTEGRPKADWRRDGVFMEHVRSIQADHPELRSSDIARALLFSPQEAWARERLPAEITEKTLRNWLSSLPKLEPHVKDRNLRRWAIPPAPSQIPLI